MCLHACVYEYHCERPIASLPLPLPLSVPHLPFPCLSFPLPLSLSPSLSLCLSVSLSLSPHPEGRRLPQVRPDIPESEMKNKVQLRCTVLYTSHSYKQPTAYLEIYMHSVLIHTYLLHILIHTYLLHTLEMREKIDEKVCKTSMYSKSLHTFTTLRF